MVWLISLVSLGLGWVGNKEDVYIIGPFGDPEIL